MQRKSKNDFKTIVSQVGEIGSNLLLKGEKFFVKADGNTKGFVIKDLELAATSALIQKNQKFLQSQEPNLNMINYYKSMLQNQMHMSAFL